jgi:hypothetical protein
VYATFDRYTAGFTDGNETTTQLNDLTRLMPGDMIRSYGRIYIEQPAYNWNTSNARPWVGHTLYPFAAGGNGSGYYPTLQEVLQYGNVFEFVTGVNTYRNTASGATYTCTVNPINNDGVAAQAYVTIQNQVIWPKSRADYPAVVTNNYRDTVINGMAYQLFEYAGETFVYAMTHFMGAYSSCGWSGIDWRDPFNLYTTAYYRLNPAFKNKYGQKFFKNTHENYADYTASSTNMQIVRPE